MLTTHYRVISSHTTVSYIVPLQGHIQSHYRVISSHTTGSYPVPLQGHIQSHYRVISSPTTGSYPVTLQGNIQSHYRVISSHTTGSYPVPLWHAVCRWWPPSTLTTTALWTSWRCSSSSLTCWMLTVSGGMS